MDIKTDAQCKPPPGWCVNDRGELVLQAEAESDNDEEQEIVDELARCMEEPEEEEDELFKADPEIAAEPDAATGPDIPGVCKDQPMPDDGADDAGPDIPDMCKDQPLPDDGAGNDAEPDVNLDDAAGDAGLAAAPPKKRRRRKGAD